MKRTKWTTSHTIEESSILRILCGAIVCVVHRPKVETVEVVILIAPPVSIPSLLSIVSSLALCTLLLPGI